MVNSSLLQSWLPASLKHVIVSQIIILIGLDFADVAIYSCRPVRNVSFSIKLVERVVAMQLNEFLTANDLLPRCQSGFRRRHSTETAMPRVRWDALAAADGEQVMILRVLDLSAAFDWLDHDLLLLKLKPNIGLMITVLA